MSDELYDRYLEECLAGRAEPPDVFCGRHPEAAGLRKQLEALYRLVDDSRAAEPAPTPAQRGLPFERLGEFRLIRPLAKGGMGSIYLAEQEGLGRVVALKIVREELRDSRTAAERFRREALAVARLSHPAIVGVHALGEEQGVRYIAMELVPGKALTEILAEHAGMGRTLPHRTAVKWVAEIARAAHHAHEHGVIHRDIKPSNIRVTPDGRPRLLDFGVARDERWKGKTVTEAFTGSPLYAAPEQLLGKPVDARADVYGLGATLYQCLTGRTPFDGETIEGLVTRMLVEDPVPVRRLNPGVPRDVEVVARKALEREPPRRYESAAALADDLEAALESRPIRARPPGPLSIVLKWARRRPWPAAVAAALVALAMFLVGQQAVAASRRTEEARAAIEEARRRVGGYQERRAATENLEAEVVGLQRAVHAHYSSAEQDRLLEEKEDSVAAARRERESAFYEVLDLLRRAEALDPDMAGDAEQVRAALYVEKWREARTNRETDAEAFYKDLATKHDRDGVHARDLKALARCDLITDPPGAEVFLFRYVEQAALVERGEHRLVPIPFRGLPQGLVPGAFALRVVKGPLAAGDLILKVAGHPVHGVMLAGSDRVLRIGGTEIHGPYEVEKAPNGPYELEKGGKVEGPLVCRTPWEVAEGGGVPATVHRNGAVEEMTLPKGLVLRPTAAPLYFGEAAFLGRTPITGLELEEGAYLAVMRHGDREELRWAFETDLEWRPVRRFTLFPMGSTPAGFLRVPYVKRDDTFLIMEREVKAGEYLEFLNDPETLARIDAAKQPALAPRSSSGPWWERDATGRYALPADLRPDCPVVGISWEDTHEYARWLTARARARGQSGVFVLPGFEEWNYAGGDGLRRRFPFGNRFRPKWISSCYARPRANVEPILRFPIDESPYGVFDMCGSAREWVDHWYDEARGLRRICGGSWAQADPDAFHFFGHGYGAQVASGDFGFRLVLREEAP